MRNFLAILRDSYREAVDGFVIYVMLALSTILILLVASLSFTPEPADKALALPIRGFAMIIPDRNASESIQVVPGLEFEAIGISQNGSTVNFRLLCRSKPEAAVFAGEDPLRFAAAAWTKRPGKPERLKLPNGFGKNKQGSDDDEATKDAGFELAKKFIPEVTPAEAAAVTDEQILEFLRGQFVAHMGISGARITMATPPTGVLRAFDVELPDATRSVIWPHTVGLFFGGVSVGTFQLGGALQFIESTVVNGFGSGTLLLVSIVLTAFFIPNLLRKGALDLIIAKPIGRVALLLYKYLGGCTFIFLVTAYTIGGVWFALGLRSGQWSPNFLVVIPALTFTFALLYAVSTLMAVLTRSAIAAILVTITFALGLYVVGKVKQFSDLNRAGILFEPWSDTTHKVIDGLNAGLPRYKDLDKLTGDILSRGNQPIVVNRAEALVLENPSMLGTIGLSSAYIAVLLGLASWRLATRDG